MEDAAHGRCVVHQVADFSIEELHSYLNLAFGERWTSIPNYMRSSLRRPLLAYVYRAVAADSAWRPNSEYELYAALWKKLADGYALDGLILKKLAQKMLSDGNYPCATLTSPTPMQIPPL